MGADAEKLEVRTNAVGEVTERFGVGRPLSTPEYVTRGAMGQVWRVETASGQWAAKRLFDWARTDNAETDARLQEAAAAAGVRLPLPVRSPDGAVVQKTAGASWRLYEWVDLGPALRAPVSPAVAAEVGSILGLIHGLALTSSEPVTPWLTQRPTSDQWKDLVARATAAGADWAPLLAAAVPQLDGLAGIADLIEPGATVLCHSDFMPGNVNSHADGGALVVLDWEHAGPQTPAAELGYVLSAWCVSGGEVDTKGAMRLVDGYERRVGAKTSPGLGMFASVACAHLNFTHSMALGALVGGEDQRHFALRNLGPLLDHPPTPAIFEALVDALV